MHGNLAHILNCVCCRLSNTKWLLCQCFTTDMTRTRQAAGCRAMPWWNLSTVTQSVRAVILSDPHLASSNLGAWARQQWAALMVNKSGRLAVWGSWREGLSWMSSWQFSLQHCQRANTPTYTCWSPDLFSRAQAFSDLDLWQPAGAQCRSLTYILTESAEGESLAWCNSARRRHLNVAWKT